MSAGRRLRLQQSGPKMLGGGFHLLFPEFLQELDVIWSAETFLLRGST